jgi:hypothetical protein
MGTQKLPEASTSKFVQKQMNKKKQVRRRIREKSPREGISSSDNDTEEEQARWNESKRDLLFSKPRKNTGKQTKTSSKQSKSRLPRNTMQSRKTYIASSSDEEANEQEVDDPDYKWDKNTGLSGASSPHSSHDEEKTRTRVNLSTSKSKQVRNVNNRPSGNQLIRSEKAIIGTEKSVEFRNKPLDYLKKGKFGNFKEKEKILQRLSDSVSDEGSSSESVSSSKTEIERKKLRTTCRGRKASDQRNSE